MSSSSRDWIAAASIGAVEALKDHQGLCRWNYARKLLHQHHSKTNIRSCTTQAHMLSGHDSSSSTNMVSEKSINKEQKLKQSEESLRTVMYLSCWGPN